MHISFNGVIRPFTYNCPYAYKLRNIDRIFPSDVLPKIERTESKEPSAADFGIEQHDLAAQYIAGTIDSFDYTTPIIEQLRASSTAIVEITKYLSLDYEPLTKRPEAGGFISYRTDALDIQDGRGVITDLKFGNPDYGHTIYYDEVDFFVFCESLHNPDVGEWMIQIHFPISDYTLPRRIYTAQRIARIQDQWIRRIEHIRNDKFCVPKPSRAHCDLCDYRPVVRGGCGICEHSAE